MAQAVALYRSRFRPSEQAAAPHVMLGLNVFAAASDAEAARLFTSHQQAFVNLRRGRPGPLPPPVDDIEAMLSPMEQAMVAHSLSCTIVGSPETVRHGIADFIARTGADELMITGQIFDHASRLRSFAIAAEARRELARAGTDAAK
jgi:alkanesulfonate monooxygenase SsuD/methylene tetrahydromethanopterin reductase-like flavin-dependent oxidoreductase (luciferase family)